MEDGLDGEAQAPALSPKKQARLERRAQALRDNLARRKDQARQREAQTDEKDAE